ncbi:P-loop containing nucleoside triphosphate hydrolase protein [Calycina marina]|uniref:P-loop containing nucleoside triphosphate hydrolase protein n=1 Tax=Calycina marina TaxID=1763456 RepID=A0A9P7Z5S2_9HELO|nr:P-loop containing nucleoside triphosphate hydrolase protein [Calycina marina]
MADAPEVSILLLGDSDVGKSTFLSRISKGSDGHASTDAMKVLRDGDQPFVFEIKFYNRPYRFEFYDTASPQNWKMLSPKIIVLCYDISSRLSLINIQRFWSKEVKRTFSGAESSDGSDIPILLLGLKRDLRSETDLNGIIYPQEAYRIAQELRCDKYMECSAVTGELVREVFEDMCKSAAMSTTEKGGLSEGGCVVM